MAAKGRRGHNFVGKKPENSGRKKGVCNKATRNVKEVFEEAFEKLGGVNAMLKWAQRPENQSAFYNLYAKLLPKDLKLTSDNTKIIYVCATKMKDRKYAQLTKKFLGAICG